MDAYWCKKLINQAMEKYGKPEIINTDQGSQYNVNNFVNNVKIHLGVRLSMNGKELYQGLEKYLFTINYKLA
jgi:putative transposase